MTSWGRKVINYELHYLYRDASNYKFRASIVVSGSIKIQDLEPHLISGEYFIPQAVGLKCLVPTERNAGDHDLHELESVTHTDRTVAEVSASTLLGRFRRASMRGWFDG